MTVYSWVGIGILTQARQLRGKCAYLQAVLQTLCSHRDLKAIVLLAGSDQCVPARPVIHQPGRVGLDNLVPLQAMSSTGWFVQKFPHYEVHPKSFSLYI